MEERAHRPTGVIRAGRKHPSVSAERRSLVPLHKGDKGCGGQQLCSDYIGGASAEASGRAARLNDVVGQGEILVENGDHFNPPRGSRQW